MPYLRTTIGRWHVDLGSPAAEAAFLRVEREGLAVLRGQPGFVRYRLMRADDRTTVAVAEWKSESLGVAGAQRFRAWLSESGIAELLTLETYAGEVIVAS
jgi:heme-degrading monooxygenase HmoA